MRLEETILTSGAVEARLVTLVGKSSFIMPQVRPVMVSARAVPLVSFVASECQS